MKSISTAIAILMLALHLVLPAESRATVSGMCSLTPENGDIDFRCDVASDDPSMDDNLYSHVGVSVFRFWAPYFAAYPNQWNDATIYNVAVQGAGCRASRQLGQNALVKMGDFRRLGLPAQIAAG